MDSLTQFTLGAALGEAVLGRRIGARAALIGGLCATLPDLDSFIPYADAVASVTYHRSFSHSLIVLSLLSPLLSHLLIRWQKASPELHNRWHLLVWLALVTHPLLDGFTVYGTQLFWPLSSYPVSGSTMFIIDPAYTLPLLLGLLAALVLGRQRTLRRWLNMGGLMLSTLYLAWSVGAKYWMEARMQRSLQAQGIAYERMLSTPAPFNTLLWRFVIMVEGGYYEAYYSVLDDEHEVPLTFYPDQRALLKTLEQHWPVQRLRWFTHGFFAIEEVNDMILMADLRMGIAPDYAFTYEVARREEAGLVPLTARQLPGGWNTERMQTLLARVFEPVVSSTHRD